MQMLSALCRWSQTIKPFRSRTSTLVFADNAMSILSNQFIVICAVTPCRNHYIDVIECDDDDTESQYFLFLLLLLLLLSSCIRCAIHGMIQMQCHILWPIPRIAMSKLMIFGGRFIANCQLFGDIINALRLIAIVFVLRLSINETHYY
eukprot:264237_1